MLKMLGLITLIAILRLNGSHDSSRLCATLAASRTALSVARSGEKLLGRYNLPAIMTPLMDTAAYCQQQSVFCCDADFWLGIECFMRLILKL